MGKGGDEPLVTASGGLSEWFAACDASIALTTYQANRLFLIGRTPRGGMRAHERRIDHCQGLWSDGQTLWASSDAMLWRFENDLADGETTEKGATRRFVPREGRVTGRIDIHDIALGDAGHPVFVATAF